MNYRILSLDGGGVRGLLTIVVLERLEKAVPNWLEKVDLIAGTSTGGVIAIGLAAGLKPCDLRHLYYHHMRAIFKDSLLDDLRDMGNLIGAEYSLDHLSQLLQKYLGKQTLRQLKKRVLIPAFDLDNENPNQAKRSWKPKFFHNFPGLDDDGDLPAYKVALYTSAAPTYFPSEDGYVDGGLVAPNPALAALTQTQDPRAELTPRPTIGDISLLSIGTGTHHRYISGKRLDWGYSQWAQPLIDLFFEGINGVADYQCQQLLKQGYHRIQPTFPGHLNVPLDGWQQRDKLIQFGEFLDLTKTIEWLNSQWQSKKPPRQQPIIECQCACSNSTQKHTNPIRLDQL